jgi:hypothetical protein
MRQAAAKEILTGAAPSSLPLQESKQKMVEKVPCFSGQATATSFSSSTINVFLGGLQWLFDC